MHCEQSTTIINLWIPGKTSHNITNFILLPQTKIKHRRYIYIYISLSTQYSNNRIILNFFLSHCSTNPVPSITHRAFPSLLFDSQAISRKRAGKERKKESLSKPAGFIPIRRSIPLFSPKSSHPFRSSSSSSRKIRVIWRSNGVRFESKNSQENFCPSRSAIAAWCSPGRQPPQSGGHLGHPRPKPSRPLVPLFNAVH